MANQAELTVFQKQVYSMMQEKETEELLQIWQANDRGEWSEDAFQVIQVILLERLGEVPEQGEPKNEEELLVEIAKPGVEIIRIAKENLGLARIALWCNRLSWVILAFAVLLAVLRFAMFLISSLPPWGGPPDQPLFSILLYLLSQLENILYAGFTFFLLQGMAAILSLLIDIRMLSGLAPAVEEGMESQA